MYFRNLLCKCKVVNENTQRQPTAKKKNNKNCFKGPVSQLLSF